MYQEIIPQRAVLVFKDVEVFVGKCIGEVRILLSNGADDTRIIAHNDALGILGTSTHQDANEDAKNGDAQRCEQRDNNKRLFLYTAQVFPLRHDPYLAITHG